MRYYHCASAFGLIAAIAIAAAHAAGPAELPATVEAGLKSVADQCSEVGGKPMTAAAVKRIDLNGDGKEDFVLDVGSVNCDGAASVYGDREKGVMVYAGDGAGGAVEAFNDLTFGSKIDGGKLWLTVAAERCGKERAADFASENFCDRPLAWNSKTKRFDYAPVSTVRMIE